MLKFIKYYKNYFFLLVLVLVNIVVIGDLDAMKKKKRTYDQTIDSQTNTKFRQFTSINQNEYESSNDNISKGSLMCGFFALYNGLKMLEIAEKNQNTIFIDHNKIDNFNEWLNNKAISLINKSKQRNNNNKGKNIIEEISDFELSDFIEEFFPDHTNINIITNTNFALRNTKPGLLGNGVLENIERFRSDNKPQLIIFNEGEHWIAIVITAIETWVMDSLGINRTDDSNIKAIDCFFRSDKILHPNKKRKLNTIDLTTQKNNEVINLDSEGEQKINNEIIDVDSSSKDSNQSEENDGDDEVSKSNGSDEQNKIKKNTQKTTSRKPSKSGNDGCVIL